MGSDEILGRQIIISSSPQHSSVI